MIVTILTIALVTIGTFFMAVAAIGLVRMPDLFMRMSAGTKAATLGVGCVLAAVAIFFGDLAMTSRAVAIFVFLLITAPVAAHIIGKAAYEDGTPLWEKTLFDDLRKDYDKREQNKSASV